MLDAWLKDRPWLLADGAAATNLFDRGLAPGDAPELWNESRPRDIRRLHQDFIDAGADIILTNSFGANARRLRLHDAEDRTHALNELAARHARAVANAAQRQVIVAGSVGPTGDLLAPLGPLTEDEAVAVFTEQIQGLNAGGADLVWIETMSAIAEMRAAATAAARVGMPYVVTASFEAAGSTSTGVTPAAMAEAAGAFYPAPHGIGCNCGAGPADLICSVLALTEAMPDAVVIAKANCGLPQRQGDRLIHPGTPELMAEYARLAVDAGARIIGGCCGTTATHLAAMHQALAAHTPRPRPDPAQVVAALGPLASPPLQPAR
ncbi:betaine--homocysteine S-methyltransferase [Limobrevibacterium gyesilva]|uniref:Betaine--homocysteine S-methyltransferase n=1 Tax=Limobrevibacterium gyesilva TaxID=2991712 RepID=A0AA42CJ81_9PROT|nr:betaine--homocysteine S-methyltransferase [Limobrevibacterium gyesilva]MCW3476657.1 betaine--homocysteine S-methyltransferase [Limobrevibacterium gyesilva]